MKKAGCLLLIPVLALAVVLCGGWPLAPMEVSELLPARVLLVERTGGTVMVSCGAATGSGAGLEQAMEDMERTAAGELLLDTVEHVVLHASAYALLDEAAQSTRLRPAARVYLGEGELPEAEEAEAYLRVHGGTVTLGTVRASLLGAGEEQPPHLLTREGRLYLIEQ